MFASLAITKGLLPKGVIIWIKKILENSKQVNGAANFLINTLINKWKTHIWMPRCEKLIEWEKKEGIDTHMKHLSHYQYTRKQ